MILSSLRRVCAAGADGASAAVWIPLVSRLITRGLEGAQAAQEEAGEDEAARSEAERRGEQLRQELFTFVTGDLQSRCASCPQDSLRRLADVRLRRTELARLWLNEEWYASKRRESTEVRCSRSRVRTKADSVHAESPVRPMAATIPRAHQCRFVEQGQGAPPVHDGPARNPARRDLPP